MSNSQRGQTMSEALEDFFHRLKNPPAPRTEQCQQHGDFEAHCTALPSGREMWSKCPKCATIAAERKERERAEEAQRQQVEREERAIRTSGVPERFASATFANYEAIGEHRKEMQRARKVAQAFAESQQPGRSLILSGTPGTGKTHLGCAIASAAIRAGRTAWFGTALRMIRFVRATYAADSHMSETQAIDSLVNVDVLVIDEIGVQNGAATVSEHDKRVLFEVINERYQQMRPTALIANLSADELGKFLGDRIMDRFAESGAIVAMTWESWRRKKAA